MRKGQKRIPVILHGPDRPASYLQGIAGLLVGLPLIATAIYSFSTAATAIAPSYDEARNFTLLIVLFFYLITGVVLSICGVVLLRVRRDCRHLSPSDEIAERLGADVYELQSIAEERGIDPVYIMGGTAYYDPAEFDSLSLLRPAENVEPSALLRPVSDSYGPSDGLLRPAVEVASAREGEERDARCDLAAG